MEIKEITEKLIWENFLLEGEESKLSSSPFAVAREGRDKTFLQSWNWGEFQIKMGNKIWRLGIFDGEKLIGTALISKIKAKRGTFLLIQHGPVIKQQEIGNNKQAFNTLLEELKKIGKEEGAIFIRMNPLWQNNEEIFKQLGFKEAPMHANAYEATWKLDITLSEEELFKNMRKTTRYLVRQASKNPDVSIEESESLDDAKIYQKLNAEVAKRQRFVPFSFEYIKNEFEVFSKDKEILWFFGKYKGELVAAALVVFWSGIGFYHQAASSLKHQKFSIPYLLPWAAIREAKKRGCNLFDFWGYTNPEKNPRHPWAGPTLFKMGFGGKAFDYVRAQDFPLSKKYWLTYLFEKARKTRRGL
jgi:lipid II:glycine glycyltransferase (peptidoglycan interpeptide bridge formation enzyme)